MNKTKFIREKWKEETEEKGNLEKDFYNEQIGLYISANNSLVSNIRVEAVDDVFEKFMKKT